MSWWSEGCYAESYLGNSTELSLMKSVACGSFTLQRSCEITERKTAWAQCQCQVSASHCQLWLGRGHVVFSFLPTSQCALFPLLSSWFTLTKVWILACQPCFLWVIMTSFPHAGTSSLELTGWALMWEDFDRLRTEITDVRFQQNIFSNHLNISWLSCVLPLGISSHQGLESRVEDLRWTPDVHVLISTVHWECRLHFSDHLWFLWSM